MYEQTITWIADALMSDTGQALIKWAGICTAWLVLFASIATTFWGAYKAGGLVWYLGGRAYRLCVPRADPLTAALQDELRHFTGYERTEGKDGLRVRTMSLMIWPDKGVIEMLQGIPGEPHWYEPIHQSLTATERGRAYAAARAFVKMIEDQVAAKESQAEAADRALDRELILDRLTDCADMPPPLRLPRVGPLTVNDRRAARAV